MRIFKPKACAVCSGMFTPTSGKTKCCEPCRVEVRREKGREANRKWRRNNTPKSTKSAPTPRPCAHCGENFTPTHSHNTLCSSECKADRGRETSSAWQKRNPERARVLQRQWQKANAGKLREYQRQRYTYDRSQAREYYQRNGERMRQKQREWQTRNPDYSQRYYCDVVKPKVEAYLIEVLKMFTRVTSHEDGKALAVKLLHPTDTAGHGVLGYSALDEILSFYLEG